MNYFAEGIQTGARIGADAVAQKKRQQEEARLDELHRQLQLDMQAKQEAAAASRQQTQIDADAARQASQQGWQSGENVADRTFRTGERQATQQFQGGQSQLDRDARAAAQDKQLAFDQKKFDVEAPLEGAKVGIEARHQAWLEDPNNPYNQIRDAQADTLRTNMGGFGLPGMTPTGGLPPTGGQFQPKTPQDAQAYQWAKSNPNDPRSKLILQRLGVAQ